MVAKNSRKNALPRPIVPSRMDHEKQEQESRPTNEQQCADGVIEELAQRRKVGSPVAVGGSSGVGMGGIFKRRSQYDGPHIMFEPTADTREGFARRTMSRHPTTTATAMMMVSMASASARSIAPDRISARDIACASRMRL